MIISRKNPFFVFSPTKTTSDAREIWIAHIFGTEPSGGVKFSGYLFSHLNRLVHNFAAKFEDPHGATYIEFCRLYGALSLKIYNKYIFSLTKNKRM